VKLWRGVTEVYSKLIDTLQIRKAIAVQCILILYSVIIKPTETVSISFKSFLKPAYSLEAIALK